jgi:polar amino acid transport system permease protein
MSSIADWSRWLYATYGVNLSIFHDSFDGQRFLTGLKTTIWLSVTCIILSLLIGVVGSWLQGSRSSLVRGLVNAYIEVLRNTPPLIQLLFFYFALSTVLPLIPDGAGGRQPLVSNVGWAIIAFSMFAGAHNIEIFRSGLDAVPSAMREAAESLGYSRFQIYRNIVFPLAFRISLPSLNNNLVNLVKTTTLAYAIAVPELLYASAQIWSESLNVKEMMNILLVTYLLLVAAVVWGMGWLERRLRIPGYSI